jgi:quercetin dioxygenase-like cupin family protein
MTRRRTGGGRRAPQDRRPGRQRITAAGDDARPPGVEAFPAASDPPRSTTMAHAGLILDNPVSGERFEFRRTAADTNGELLEFDLTLAADGHVPGAHVHPEQEERFVVQSGRVRFRLGMKKIVAGPGDVVVVPAGKVHAFRNVGGEEAKVRVQVTPALDMEQLFEATVAMAEAGQTNRKGMPKPMHLALFVRRFRREVRAPFPPAPIVNALLAPLALIAAKRGHAERYARPAALTA